MILQMYYSVLCAPLPRRYTMEVHVARTNGLLSEETDNQENVEEDEMPLEVCRT